MVLLEKNELTSGSTWHAAGGVTTLNSDANVSRLQKYTFDLYRELEPATGLSCGIHHNGGIYLAASEGQMDFLKLIHSRARYLKMDTELIPVSEAKKRNVLIDEASSRARCGARMAAMSTPGWSRRPMWRRPAQHGAEVNRFTKVTGLSSGPRALDVVTDNGHHRGRARRQRRRALGARGRQAGRLELPVLAMEHHYIVTEPIPELKGLEREIINTTDFSGEIYLRQEGQGVLLGTYEQDCARLVGRR